MSLLAKIVTFLVFVLTVGAPYLFANPCADAFKVERFKDGYSWDTWVLYDAEEQMYHSYSQWISSHEMTKDSFEFHNKAKIRHRISRDGLKWQDLGLINISNDPIQIHQLAYWSGSAIKKDGIYYLFYTRGSNEHSLSNGDQRIHVATSSDGHNFKFKSEILSPQIIKATTIYNYDFSFSKQGDKLIIPALRDPHVFQYQDHWVMLFSANLKQNGNVVHAIGRAESRDLMSWEVKEPIRISPQNASEQFELPNIAYVFDPILNKKIILLMVSSRSQGANNLQFWRADSLDGPWDKVPIAQDIDLRNFYGFNFIKGKNKNLALSFFNEKTLKVHSKPQKIYYDGEMVYFLK